MLKRIQGFKLLLHDTVDLVLDLVEHGHESTARNIMRVLHFLAPNDVPLEPLKQVDQLRRGVTRGTLGAVRAVNRLVQLLTDAGLDAALALRLLPALRGPARCVPMRSDAVGSAAWLTDAAIGALNGAVGDYLHRSGNGLELGFFLRHGDALIALQAPDDKAGDKAGGEADGAADGAAAAPCAVATGLPAGRRVAIFLHGLLTTEWSWCWDSAVYHGDPALNFGALLQRDLGITPLYARYNSGRRVAESAQVLADGLERLLLALPEADRPEEILLIGHSMGGLVARSACHQAEHAGYEWVKRVSRVFCLGTPHQGAPLAKLGHALTGALMGIDLPGTRISGEILRRRSAGIKDLRRGAVASRAQPPAAAPADGEDDCAAPLLDHIAYHFVSATITQDQAHPLGWLLGDVMVRPKSAAGPAQAAPSLRIHTATFGGVVHHQLQNHPDVYRWLADACSDREARSAAVIDREAQGADQPGSSPAPRKSL